MPFEKPNLTIAAVSMHSPISVLRKIFTIPPKPPATNAVREAMTKEDRRIVSATSEGSILLADGLYDTQEDLDKERQRVISID